MIAGILMLMALPFLPGRLDVNLLLVVRAGDDRAAAVLIQAGASVDQADTLTGWTPLMVACFYGYPAVVRELLSAGANPNTIDLHGGTPLMKAVAMPGDSAPGLTSRKVDILKLLLAAGADPQKKDALGGKVWQTAMIFDQNEFVDVFAAAGVRGVRETQLMEAIARQDAAAVQSLLSAGSDVNFRDEDGWNALSEAALGGNAGIVRDVLAHGAEVNARYQKGWTALMIAAHSTHADAVRLLLAAGADPALRADDGATALDIATTSGCGECAHLLHIP